MLDLFKNALNGDPDALGGVASILTVVALLPAAIVFVVNQVLQNLALREEKYRFLHDQYFNYLNVCLAHPEFQLERGRGVSYRTLDPISKQKLSLILEIYTSIIEAAFKIYQNAVISSRKTQWLGWVSYLDRYLDRTDYFEFVIDWQYGGDLSISEEGEIKVGRAGLSEYDTDFENFFLERMRLAWLRRRATS